MQTIINRNNITAEKMKKIFTIILFIWVCSDIALSQDCEICGTWINTARVFTNGDNTIRKRYIRIRQHGESYSVQVKDVYTYDAGNTKTYYWHECTSVSINGNLISWRSFSHDIDEWDYGEKYCNGKMVGYAKYYYVCSASAHNGVLTFRHTPVGVYYDSNRNYIGEDTQPIQNVWEERMYKEDEDW